jgi:hypothetical protein
MYDDFTMIEWSRYLFLAGALPFIVLGVLHAILTPRAPEQKSGLSPRDPALREAMTRETLFLTRRTTLWRTWVGFNFSHSLGAVILGSAVLLAGSSATSFHEQAPKFVPFAVVAGAIYLAIGIPYWFRTPILGIAIAEGCFLTSWLLLAAS